MNTTDERVFPDDPDLDEPGAEKLLAEAAASEEPEQPASAMPLVRNRQVPVIKPADPLQWQQDVLLERPLIVDDQLLSEITVRCLTGEEFVNLIMAYGTSESTIMPEIRAAMCGVHPAVIAALSADDQARVVAACRPFFPRPLQEDPDDADIVASALSAVGDLPR